MDPLLELGADAGEGVAEAAEADDLRSVGSWPCTLPMVDGDGWWPEGVDVNGVWPEDVNVDVLNHAEANGPDPVARPVPEQQEESDDDSSTDDGSSADDGSSTDDDSTTSDEDLLFERVDGFREAVRVLRNSNGRRPIDSLYVSNLGPGDRADDSRWFPEFVALLGHQEIGRSVRDTFFVVDWKGLPDKYMEELFGRVLPSHRSLQSIRMSIHGLSARFLRMLMESIPAVGQTSLSRLWLISHDLDPASQAQAARAIADVLGRNAAIVHLTISIDLKPDECRLICQALRRNTNMRSLTLNVPAMFADTLEGVAVSSLEDLSVEGSFSEGTVLSLARELRTNETLKYLHLNTTYDGYEDPEALLDVVKTYNHTLESMRGNLLSEHGDEQVREQFDKYMERNARIRRMIYRLPLSLRPTAVCKELPVLKMVSDHPTLLYRILKQSYADSVSDLLAARQTTTSTSIERSESCRDRSSPLAKRRRILG